MKTGDVPLLKHVLPIDRWERTAKHGCLSRDPDTVLRNALLGSFRRNVIPIMYQRASKTQRLRLLQGLKDSDDRSVSKRASNLSSTERRLAESAAN